MADSIREQIVAAFASRISALRAAQLDGEMELPARTLWDPTESSEMIRYGKVENTLTINVAEMAQRDHGIDSSTQGNAMLAALLEVALNSDQTLGGLAQRIDYVESTLDAPDPGQNEMIILVTFQVIYRTTNTSPYTQ